MDICDASRIGKKATQLSKDLYYIGDNFLVGLHVFEKSDPSSEIYVDFGLVATVA